MHAGLQTNIAFHVTGKRLGTELDAIDDLNLRPALLAEYADLTALRYDFPLVLVQGAEGAASVQSLSGLFDGALAAVGGGADGDRLRQHAQRLERAIRTLAAEGEAGSLSESWQKAASRLSTHNDELFQDSLKRLRAAIKVDGRIVSCDQDLPFSLFRHVWNAVQESKARRFHEQVDRLIAKLSDILGADLALSPEGLKADRLKASIGATFQTTFDFDALARVLTDASPKASLPESRRQRIRRLLSVLQSQRFFAAPRSGEAAYSFMFDSCTEAIEAYQERLPQMVELAKAMAMAELEIEGDYEDARHDAFFADFGSDGVDPRDSQLFPDYLITVRTADMKAADNEIILKAMSAGMQAKVLVQVDDLLEPSPIGGAQLAFGWRSRQLASTAIGLATSFVLQSSASNLFRFREQIVRGLTYPGPALFSVFVGSSDGALPPYLAAAAAMESRVFPAFAYDPSAGRDWAARFDLGDNPQADTDWPVHDFDYEDEDHQRTAERMAFTLIDFVACDRRYARHFARVPRAKWNGNLAPVTDFLAGEPSDLADKVPCLLMVDRSNALHKVIVDDKLVREARHCAEMWHSLQELGGIHNSHAERLLAREREAWAQEMEAQLKAARASAAPAAPAAAPAPAAPAPGAAAAAAAPEAAEPEVKSDEAYIETPRCTSCNECTQINDKMFVYNENKQAYIADPRAGTYRQMVEAAEGCQVSIIHPGKPLNPDEPGLDELKKRAEPFL